MTTDSKTGFENSQHISLYASILLKDTGAQPTLVNYVKLTQNELDRIASMCLNGVCIHSPNSTRCMRDRGIANSYDTTEDK